jgi:hypothetical protein
MPACFHCSLEVTGGPLDITGQGLIEEGALSRRVRGGGLLHAAAFLQPFGDRGPDDSGSSEPGQQCGLLLACHRYQPMGSNACSSGFIASESRLAGLGVRGGIVGGLP